jgi:hypothetical protein
MTIIKQLFLDDFEQMTDAEVRSRICSDYAITEADELSRFDVLIAQQYEGAYGCDSNSWFLLRERATGNLFENHGSHCSCYGFEGQFKPESTTEEYLRSTMFGKTANVRFKELLAEALQ